MASSQSYDDVVNEIEETLGIAPPWFTSQPEDDVVSEWPFFKKYTVEESEIPPKYRELMGLATAANIKCPYCAHFHTEAAKLHGATDAEIREAVALSSLTSRYSAMLHAQQYDMDQFRDEVKQIGDHMQAMAADD